MKKINLDLPEDLERRLTAQAALIGVDVGTYVADLLTKAASELGPLPVGVPLQD